MALNPQQEEAAKTFEGPMLILAGAGTGKTSTMVDRMANMIGQGIPAYNILAITFTNKAANEMRERIERKIGSEADNLFVSTFHSMCVRIIRRDVDYVKGLERNFTIFDTDDSKRAMKQIVAVLNKDVEDDDEKVSAETMREYISMLKNEMVDVETFLSGKPSNPYIDWEKAQRLIYGKIDSEHMEDLKTVYPLYQEFLKMNNAVDFDDLISKTVELFIEHPHVLERWQNRFHYIMVDEYQDTNHAQYVLVKLLAQKNRNLAVVGDDAQAIYSFRGSDIRNILNFEKDYPEAKVIKLEQNYRCTKAILSVANDIIANNTEQREKVLFTENQQGASAKIHKTDRNTEEAAWIADRIFALRRKGKNFSDIAVLYRNRSISSLIERELKKWRIPTEVVGGLSFFGTKEVKDIVSYLQFLENPNLIAFERIINTPKRGIGKTSVDKMLDIARTSNIVDVLKDPTKAKLPAKAKTSVNEFAQMYEKWLEMKETSTIANLIETIIEDVKYKEEELRKLAPDIRRDKEQNLKQLVSIANEMEKSEGEEFSLAEFLEEVTLGNETEEEGSKDRVTLMTIHSAKGLEFPIVFVPGMVEDVLPSVHSIAEGNVEEERRLCYVAVTRAKEELYMSFPRKQVYPVKDKSGNIIDWAEEKLHVSRFLKEIKRENFEMI